MLDENIRVMRREKGLTQEQLAEVMGVSTASVSKWETGVAAPELGMLAALADFFEVSIDALIGHTVGKAQLKEKIDEIKSFPWQTKMKKPLGWRKNCSADIRMNMKWCLAPPMRIIPHIYTTARRNIYTAAWN